MQCKGKKHKTTQHTAHAAAQPDCKMSFVIYKRYLLYLIVLKSSPTNGEIGKPKKTTDALAAVRMRIGLDRFCSATLGQLFFLLSNIFLATFKILSYFVKKYAFFEQVLNILAFLTTFNALNGTVCVKDLSLVLSFGLNVHTISCVPGYMCLLFRTFCTDQIQNVVPIKQCYKTVLDSLMHLFLFNIHEYNDC